MCGGRGYWPALVRSLGGLLTRVSFGVSCLGYGVVWGLLMGWVFGVALAGARCLSLLGMGIERSVSASDGLSGAGRHVWACSG